MLGNKPDAMPFAAGPVSATFERLVFVFSPLAADDSISFSSSQLCTQLSRCNRSLFVARRSLFRSVQ